MMERYRLTTFQAVVRSLFGYVGWEVVWHGDCCDVTGNRGHKWTLRVTQQ